MVLQIYSDVRFDEDVQEKDEDLGDVEDEAQGDKKGDDMNLATCAPSHIRLHKER